MKDKSAQSLGRKRWKGKTKKEKREHALMMVSKRGQKEPQNLDTTASVVSSVVSG